MKRNSLQRLAILAADLPESDLADVVDFAEKLHRQHCFWAFNVAIDRNVLADLDLRFCRIEALADYLGRTLENTADRTQLGAVEMLTEEVEQFRKMLDKLDI